MSITVLCLLLAGGGSPMSANPASVFKEGVSHYDQGHFEQAAKLFEGVAKSSGSSAAIEYNLGCTWFRLEDYPRAILHFERALLHEPSNKLIRENLELARLQQLGTVPAVVDDSGMVSRLIEAALSAPGLNGATLWVVLAWWGLFLGLAWALSQRDKARRGPALMLAVVAGVLLLPAVLSFAYQRQFRLQTRHGVILAQEVALLSAPKPGAETVYDVTGGLKVTVERKLGGYYQVFSPNYGARGWVSADALGLIEEE